MHRSCWLCIKYYYVKISSDSYLCVECSKKINLPDAKRTLQKPHIDGLRYADKIAARTQPDPLVPLGPYHKSSKVYYYTRDARRAVEPPSVIYTADRLEAG